MFDIEGLSQNQKDIRIDVLVTARERLTVIYRQARNKYALLGYSVFAINDVPEISDIEKMFDEIDTEIRSLTRMELWYESR